MLTNLRLKHFGLITETELQFENGFTVLTGETGAGKSMIIDAIGLLCGKQANEDYIQSQQESAIIEGIFKCPNPSDQLSDYVEEGTLIIFRRLSRTKGNMIRINNQTVTLKTLRQVMSQQLNIIGQHEYMSLCDPHFQRKLIDRHGGEALLKCLTNYQTAYSAYHTCKSRYQQLQTNAQDRSQKLEFLAFQINDITQYNFTIGEEDDLQNKRKQAKQFHDKQTHFNQAKTALSHVQEHLNLCTQNIHKCVQLDEKLTPFLASLEKTNADLTHDSEELDDLIQQLNTFSDIHIDAIEQRLDDMFKMKTKYHVASIDLLCEKVTALQQEQTDLITFIENHSVLENELKQHLEKAQIAANTLNVARNKSASNLSIHIQTRASTLGFLDINVKLTCHYSKETLTEYGSDQITFTCSLNPGEPLKPIENVASGGELSRLMLAIQTLPSAMSDIPTLIFDEIDTGVGGLTANAIGEYLATIAKKKQVFCVTHLAQIAKFSTHHCVVSKQVENKSILTAVHWLTKDTKPKELERMIGGASVVNQLPSR